jgi:hypothetical protein
MSKLLLALILLALPAWADTLDYRFTQTATHFEFPQFDPALGQLTAIDFNLSARFSGSLTYNNNSDTAGWFQFNFAPLFAITSPIGLSQIKAPLVGMVGNVPPHSSMTRDYFTNAFGYAQPTNLELFLGQGSWTLDGYENADFSYYGISKDANLSGPLMARNPAELDANLVYSYTPALLATENPEPAFYGVVGLLLVGMFCTLKLKRLAPCE